MNEMEVTGLEDRVRPVMSMGLRGRSDPRAEAREVLDV